MRAGFSWSCPVYGGMLPTEKMKQKRIVSHKPPVYVMFAIVI